MKFNMKKFQKDRDRSKERSKKGELELLEHMEGRSNLKEIINNIIIIYSDKECNHLNVGCDLPFVKRNMPKCKECPMIK